ncbi:MAG TPA: hypothetical protein ENO20_14260 [Bacteroides sp.]|nr:hypothetical protein [Bacteroides sp.]
MIVRTQFFRFLLLALSVFLPAGAVLQAAGGITLYTPYTSISVPPGESIDYSVEVRNDGSVVRNVDLRVTGLPEGWEATLKAGGYLIRQISVLPGEKKTLSFQVNVPLKVDKGNHSFRLVATNYDALTLVVNVSEQGTFKTEFTSDQANMEGHSDFNFTFSTKLKNQTGVKQMYSLRAGTPRGWNVVFKPNYKQATAVEVEPGQTANISVEIKPPHAIEAGTYRIPVQAVNSATSAEMDLEVVITGSYEMELTTPNGLLSAKTTAGKEKRIELLLKNTGSGELENVIFRAASPRNWDVQFTPDTVAHLKPGENAGVYATITAADKAIPGDYVTRITARTPEASSEASFRISVKTPLLWGWLGILIIVAIIGLIYYLFRKYGRR